MIYDSYDSYRRRGWIEASPRMPQVVDGRLTSPSPSQSKLNSVSNLGDPYTPAEATTARIFTRLSSRIGAIIMTSADEAANAVADQLGKAKGEIDAVIAELEAQSVRPETIQRLQNISQALDDVVPDQPPSP